MKKHHHFIIISVLILAFLSFLVDDALLPFFEKIHNPLLDVLFSILTNFAFILTLFLIIPGFYFLSKRKFRKTLFLVFTFVTSLTFSIALKYGIGRPRPLSPEMSELVRYSFPSTHSLVVFALLPFLQKEFPNQKYVLMGLAGLMVFTRLYFSFHYVSDVIFGMLIGYGIGWYLSRKV